MKWILFWGHTKTRMWTIFRTYLILCGQFWFKYGFSNIAVFSEMFVTQKCWENVRCHAGDNDGPESVMLVIHLMWLQSSTKILMSEIQKRFFLKSYKSFVFDQGISPNIIHTNWNFYRFSKFLKRFLGGETEHHMIYDFF